MRLNRVTRNLVGELGLTLLSYFCSYIDSSRLVKGLELFLYYSYSCIIVKSYIIVRSSTVL